MNEEKKRSGGNTLIGWLIVFTILGAFMMFFMGRSALDMGEEQKEMNQLMHNQSIACSDSNTKEKCREATKEVEDYYGDLKKRFHKNK